MKRGCVIDITLLCTCMVLMCERPVYAYVRSSTICCADWFHATQAMAIIGLVGLGIALLLIVLYMCIHNVSKNSTIIGLVVTCFLSGMTLAPLPSSASSSPASCQV